MSNIIHLRNAAKIFGTDQDIVAEVVTITPEQATQWLRCNKNNRPVRRRHVAFLADEMVHGNWQVNGQAIIIADDEQVLDGQHRLLAIIEAGRPVQSMVVYGITPEAFKTIDTGAVRTGADALALHFHETNSASIKCVATAVQWCKSLEACSLHSKLKTSNTDVIAYVKSHPSLLQCAETLQSYPKDARPLSLGLGTALYEMFARKKADLADKFMRDLYTGESLVRTDVEWLLRQAFIRDAQRTSKLPATARVRMVIKGWNWRRRGMMDASYQTIAIQANDDQKIRIL